MKGRAILDYAGKTVYVGIDVHKKNYAITVICDGNIVKQVSCLARNKVLADSLKDWFRGATIKCAYEAGFSGFALHRVLVAEGIQSIVVNAASIQIAANDRVKNDKRDSRKIAAELAAGKLHGIYIPTLQQEHQRLLPRTRDQLVRLRASVANRVKAKLFQFGLLGCNDDAVVSGKFLDACLAKELANEIRFTLEILADEWQHLTRSIAKIERAMKEQASGEPQIEAVYRSVPGIGPVTSRVLATELGDLSRFANVRGLYCYTGLTPSEYSSGGHVRRGHISRQGSPRIRHVLVEAAWRAISDDPSLAHIYHRIKARRGGKIAIVAVARHLIGRVRACFRTTRLYGIPVQSNAAIIA